jgi:hypothetical protein
MLMSLQKEKGDGGMTTITKKNISEIFNEFYGKVDEPRFNRIDKKLEDHDKKFNDLLTHFDQIYNRLD